MAFATDYRRTVPAIIAVACTAVLVWFGTGLYPKWPLLWLAPLPVLLLAVSRGDAVSRGKALLGTAVIGRPDGVTRAFHIEF